MPAHRIGQEYPTNSGIIITPRKVPSGRAAWRVEVPAGLTGLHRERRQFPSREGACEYAVNRWQEIRAVGRQAFALSPAQRSDATHALSLLCGHELSLTSAVQLALKSYTAPQARITVSDLRNRFLSEPGRRKNKLVERRGRSIADLRVRTAILATHCGETPVTGVTSNLIKAWLAGMPRLSPVTRNNFRRVAHALFAFGVREGFCPVNPVAQVAAYSVAQTTPSILTVEDARSLVVTAAASDTELGLLPYVLLGLFAGLRRAELERLDWSAVKFDREMVTVGADIAKTGSIRNVRLTDNALSWLESYRGKSGRIVPINFNKRFRELRRRAGIIKWEGNELRHSFASYFYDLTQDAAQTSAQLGHQSGVRLLFEHYRSLVPLGEGAKFFGILPTAALTTRLIEEPTPATAITATVA